MKIESSSANNFPSTIFTVSNCVPGGIDACVCILALEKSVGVIAEVFQQVIVEGMGNGDFSFSFNRPETYENVALWLIAYREDGAALNGFVQAAVDRCDAEECFISGKHDLLLI